MLGDTNAPLDPLAIHCASLHPNIDIAQRHGPCR